MSKTTAKYRTYGKIGCVLTWVALVLSVLIFFLPLIRLEVTEAPPQGKISYSLSASVMDFIFGNIEKIPDFGASSPDVSKEQGLSEKKNMISLLFPKYIDDGKKQTFWNETFFPRSIDIYSDNPYDDPETPKEEQSGFIGGFDPVLIFMSFSVVFLILLCAKSGLLKKYKSKQDRKAAQQKRQEEDMRFQSFLGSGHSNASVLLFLISALNLIAFSTTILGRLADGVEYVFAPFALLMSAFYLIILIRNRYLATCRKLLLAMPKKAEIDPLFRNKGKEKLIFYENKDSSTPKQQSEQKDLQEKQEIVDEEEAIELLQRYKRLLDKGAITEQEFSKKKEDLLINRVPEEKFLEEHNNSSSKTKAANNNKKTNKKHK